ncbi:putative DNA base hypermodification protein [Mesorhizobium sp. MSK_1335]|uniref:DNA base hypermodification protein n=1 Tax=Mesorhizobium montanum TaxID=3072323 RepID=A0ABU4ZQR0_9HYPH|nr:nucleotide kinase domain-containing protein [Mesorhizobium sp. MSK_1335]MDX8527747.1 putative DNA base hypermodification protein [Mesorhizobium sp. MSK_1335]
MDPTPVFETFWRFAAERQAIYFRRLAGEPAPWTVDSVLLTYRFTNAYRASDRVSQFLIRDVQYREDRQQTPDELFFRTLLFKIFNKVETWAALERELGPLSYSRTDFNAIIKVLDHNMARGKRLYSAAYIMPAPVFGHRRKHANHLALLKAMMDDGLPDRIRQASGLSGVYDLLRRYSGIGPFLAFQYAIDLNYSELLNHDEGSFVVAGPGALDGISKCFYSIGRLTAEDVIHQVCDQQESAFERAGTSFQSLFGRRLQPIDCQNLFCEISKYARVAHPDVAGLTGRTRIKQIYRPSTEPLPSPVFPPRWNLKADMPASDLQPSQQLRLGKGLFA